MLKYAGLLVGVLVIAALCWWFGLAEVLAALRGCSPARLTIYLGLTAAVIGGYSARWWLVGRAMDAPVPFARCVAARLSGDAVGSLVPSAKLAGEPLRVALVRSPTVPLTATAAVVTLDRLLELIGNTIAVLAYLTVFALGRRFVVGTHPLALAALMLLLLAALLSPLVLAWRGRRPLALLYAPRLRRALPRLSGWFDALAEVETHLVRFFRARPRIFIAGVGAALTTELLIVLQYHALLGAFGIALDLPTLLLVLLGGGLARVAPLPGGVGALEATQTLLVGAASGRADLGFVVAVIVRLHELLMLALGFAALAVQGLWRPRWRGTVAMQGTQSR